MPKEYIGSTLFYYLYIYLEETIKGSGGVGLDGS